jgi:large subunit ribosomal protein L24
MSLIKREDLVKVITGKSKGKTGKVLKVIREKNQVVVEGANRAKKHEKPNAKNEQGGIVDKEMPIHLSNVMLVSPKSSTPVKLIRVKNDKGKWVRAEKKTKVIID